tara:strand:- start:78625 stop:79572 length:948 start_codon:yes stop_codon:yes gene_type:complete
MHLKELIQRHQQKAQNTVPEWMIGCFKRRSISFANGLSDTQTQVFWLQGRKLTIDLRLPQEADQVSKLNIETCTQDELYKLANYEGWSAESKWENNQLSWSGGTSFQLHNRWPEPGILSRVGDCMMEFSPSHAYVEDWRIKSRTPGPLVSLRLIEEKDLTTETCRHRGGALIINGNWAGLVLGRCKDIPLASQTKQLRDLFLSEISNKKLQSEVFNFETSVAQGSLEKGFKICFSNQPGIENDIIFPLEGFEFDAKQNEVFQLFNENDHTILRRFAIDTIEASFPYSDSTEWTKEASTWFKNEQETLGRYLNITE